MLLFLIFVHIWYPSCQVKGEENWFNWKRVNMPNIYEIAKNWHKGNAFFSDTLGKNTDAHDTELHTPHPFFNFLFTYLFSIKFLYFLIISSLLFLYFSLFVSLFIQSYVNSNLRVSTLSMLIIHVSCCQHISWIWTRTS